MSVTDVGDQMCWLQVWEVVDRFKTLENRQHNDVTNITVTTYTVFEYGWGNIIGCKCWTFGIYSNITVTSNSNVDVVDAGAEFVQPKVLKMTWLTGPSGCTKHMFKYAQVSLQSIPSWCMLQIISSIQNNKLFQDMHFAELYSPVVLE